MIIGASLEKSESNAEPLGDPVGGIGKFLTQFNSLKLAKDDLTKICQALQGWYKLAISGGRAKSEVDCCSQLWCQYVLAGNDKQITIASQ